jgi:phosphoribosylanthranilate isomerase
MLPKRTRVKVCGLCHAQDAEAAVRAGADAVGVIMAESRREVSMEEAHGVMSVVPPFVSRVAVFVDAPEEFVEDAARTLHLSYVQFHGDESPERCAAAPVPVIKMFRVGPGFDPAVMEPYRGAVAAILLDTLVVGVAGGSGRTFAWSRVPPLPDWAPVIVAGGLNAVNVGAAVRALRPYAVDVSSGVEERLRNKDPERMHAFCLAVRSADEEGM